MEHTIRAHAADLEEVTDVWEVQEATGAGALELRLLSRRRLSAQTLERGEAQVLSARDPALWQRHKFEAVAEVIKSVSEGTERVQEYRFRLTVPEYRELFDGLSNSSASAWPSGTGGRSSSRRRTCALHIHDLIVTGREDLWLAPTWGRQCPLANQA